jgi:hypothetical protein
MIVDLWTNYCLIVALKPVARFEELRAMQFWLGTILHSTESWLSTMLQCNFDSALFCIAPSHDSALCCIAQSHDSMLCCIAPSRDSALSCIAPSHDPKHWCSWWLNAKKTRGRKSCETVSLIGSSNIGTRQYFKWILVRNKLNKLIVNIFQI